MQINRGTHCLRKWKAKQNKSKQKENYINNKWIANNCNRQHQYATFINNIISATPGRSARISQLTQWPSYGGCQRILAAVETEKVYKFILRLLVLRLLLSLFVSHFGWTASGMLSHWRLLIAHIHTYMRLHVCVCVCVRLLLHLGSYSSRWMRMLGVLGAQRLVIVIADARHSAAAQPVNWLVWTAERAVGRQVVWLVACA